MIKNNSARYKNIFKILCINAVLIGFGIIILELIFGGWIHQNKLNRLNLRTSSTLKFDVSNLYKRPNNIVTYTRDAYSLRGHFKHPSEIDILTIGGSTTDQRYIDDSETWQDFLQQNFTANHKKIVVANAGVDGQSTFGHIKNFEWWFPNIPDLHPKFILFYIGINDFYTTSSTRFDALVKEDQKKSIGAMLYDKSAVWYLYRTLKGIYQAEILHKLGHRSIYFQKVEWTDKPLYNNYDKLLKKRLTAYSQRLEILAKHTKQLDATLVFVTQPSRKYKLVNDSLFGVTGKSKYEGVAINGVDYFYMIQKLNEVTLEICGRHNGICLDMAKELTLWDNADFYDFAHMTPRGTQKVGKYLYEKLKDQIQKN